MGTKGRTLALRQFLSRHHRTFAWTVTVVAGGGLVLWYLAFQEVSNDVARPPLTANVWFNIGIFFLGAAAMLFVLLLLVQLRWHPPLRVYIKGAGWQELPTFDRHEGGARVAYSGMAYGDSALILTNTEGKTASCRISLAFASVPKRRAYPDTDAPGVLGITYASSGGPLLASVINIPEGSSVEGRLVFVVDEDFRKDVGDFQAIASQAELVFQDLHTAREFRVMLREGNPAKPRWSRRGR